MVKPSFEKSDLKSFLTFLSNFVLRYTYLIIQKNSKKSSPRVKFEKLKVGADLGFLGKKRTKIRHF